MPNLLTVDELATWTRQDIATVAADPFAELVLTTASELIADTANQPNWLNQTPPVAVPRVAKRICMFLAGRTYLNPDGEISTSVGPLGSRVPEKMAMAAANMSLLEDERLQLESLASPPGGLFTIATTNQDVAADTTVWLPVEGGGDWLPYGDDSTTLAFTPVTP